MSTAGVAMTVQEMKKLIRQRIQQELSSVPNALYEKLWLVRERNLRELAEEDVCEADILEGDVGLDYVDAMRLLLDGWGVALQCVPAFASRLRRRHSNLPADDLITTLWDALPERDKRAMGQVWEFAYKVLDPHAEEFRKRFTQGRVLTQSEAVEWITAKENGCCEVSTFEPVDEWWYYVEDRDVPDTEEFTAILDGHQMSIHVEDGSPLQSLATFVMFNDMAMGLPAKVISLFILTGQMLPPRIPVMWLTPMYDLCLCLPQQAHNVVPLFPPYLSAEGVERAWRSINYDGNIRSWVLFHYRLNDFSSYEEAMRAWNKVAPTEWRIDDYRTFHRLWWRAGEFEREKEKPRATPTCSDELDEACAKSVDCFCIFPMPLPEELSVP